MLRLKRYLKPFLGGLIVAIVLLFAQAMCDLNLPNYMANIVNVGVQNNGFEHASPEQISVNGMTLVQTFMTPDEIVLVNSNYTLTDSAWQRNAKIPNDTLSSMDTAFGTATMTMVFTLQTLAQQSGQATDTTDTQSLENFGLTQLQELYDQQPMFNQIPAAIIADARAKAQAMDSMFRDQSGTMLAGIFYTELGGNLSAHQTNYILRIGGIMLAFALGSGICTVLVSFLSSRIAAGVARRLRRDVFAKVESFSHAEFDKFSTASLITRSTNDVTQMQMLLAIGIRMICYAPMMAVGGTIMALRKSVSMGWIIAAICIVLIGIILILFVTVVPKFKSMQKFIDRVNLVARETLSGLMVIRAFSNSRFEEKRFDGANRDLARVNLFVTRAMTFMMPAMMLVMNGASLLIVWTGSHQANAGSMQVGDMIAFMQYAMQIIMSFLFIAMMFVFIPRASVSGARIADVLETQPSIVDPVDPQHIEAGSTGTVEFRNVCFRYGGAEEDVLKSITFTASPGQTTAFIG
ncbi:MAG: ABC transporter ATP-binding protein, partial [Oscillospiraceae bacterium]|nr:ABC transporter ATP-binding protein [Oscillospiraceae bacterium]